MVPRHLSGHGYDLTATFVEESGGTRLTWRMLFASAAEHEKMRAFVTGANEQNFDRLEEELSRRA